MTIIGPDANGVYKLVLGALSTLDGDLNAVIDLMQKSLETARKLDPKWTLLSAVKTMGIDVGGLHRGLAFYVDAIQKWAPADNTGGEKLS